MALLAIVALRTLGDGGGDGADDGVDAELDQPGAAPAPTAGIPTQADITGAALPAGAHERLDGGELQFSEFAGRPLVVNFWAAWCEPCKAEMPALARVSEAVGDRVGFVGVNVNDGVESARRLADSTGITYPSVRDPDGGISAALEIVRMPTTLFVSPAGTVVAYHPGELTEAELTAEIDRLFPASPTG